ncbi:UNVERIFIED_CONTAM: hypothetical protein PYX00_005651 [Menopon gallinae]|uniref:Nose resistant-to-fluoxetine protein N-terminal domain-containing protein n=1 Tax=Menopon gallinae TaxID=328185 RepID=A0AAW2HSR5_9NEOP
MLKFLFFYVLIVPVLSSRERLLKTLQDALLATDIKNEILSLREADPDSHCWADLESYINGLKTEKWAQIMFDSIEKLPDGFLYGRNEFLGNFDECLSVRTEWFKGQHCMVDIKLPGKPLIPGLGTMDGLRISYGLCLPSSCKTAEIQQVLNLIQMPDGMNITVDEKCCWTDDPITLSSEDWIVICFLGAVGLIAICSTLFDVLHTRIPIKSTRTELYTSFSLYKNFQQLTKIYTGPDNIGCLHGIRTLSMCWVILGHEYITRLFGPLINMPIFFTYMTSKSKIFVTNAFVSVDTFFLLSGFLATLVFFREISKKKSFDVPLSILHRYIRITPPFAAMVLIQSTLLMKMGKGPLWNSRIGQSVEMCRDNWWPGLIYLQNFIAPNSTCLGQSWYLSSDMQMFWLAPILLYPLLLWRKIGIVAYCVGLAAALITNFAVSFEYGLGPGIFFTTSPKQFNTDYVQTYMRLAPYIVGMGLGYIVCGVKAKKIRVNLSKMWIVLGWLLSAGLCLGSLYGIVYFIDNGLQDKQWESSSYLTFHRLGWALGLSWVIFACIVGYGGPVNVILSWNPFQFFGKLSYSMFLVHFTIQTYVSATSRTNTYADDFPIVTNYFSTLAYSLIFSIPLYLLFEAPFGNLDKYFLRDMKIFPYPRPRATETAKDEPERGVDNKAFVESTAKPDPV